MKMVDAILAVQDGRCFYCGGDFSGPPHGRLYPGCYTRDHVFPKSRGFTSHNNFILACGSCNWGKGNREPTKEEVGRAYVVMQKSVRLMRIANGSVPDGWSLDRSVITLPRVYRKPMRWCERLAAVAAMVVRP